MAAPNAGAADVEGCPNTDDDAGAEDCPKAGADGGVPKAEGACCLKDPCPKDALPNAGAV